MTDKAAKMPVVDITAEESNGTDDNHGLRRVTADEVLQQEKDGRGSKENIQTV